MKCKTLLLLSLVALALIPSPEDAGPRKKSAKLTTVRIGYVSRSILDMPFIIARDRGYFREEGLEPELIFIKAAQTIPAMLAGGIDSARATGTAITAALSGIDVRVVFAMSDKPSFDLIALPSITNLQQMRVRNSASPRSAPSPKLSPARFFLANKLPQEQVTFIPLGTSDVLYVALKAGTIDATMLQIRRPFSPWMRAFASSPPARILPCRARRPDYNEGNHFRTARARHQDHPAPRKERCA